MATLGSMSTGRPARESDIGFLISLARDRSIYVHELNSGRVELQDTRNKQIVFSGSTRDAVQFIRDRRTT